MTPTTPPFRTAVDQLLRLDETHDTLAMRPEQNSSLRYVIPIPKGWGRVTSIGEGPGDMPTIIGAFSPEPELSGPRVIVSVCRPPFEVDPCAWVRTQWERAGWQIAVAGPIEHPFGGRFEVGGMKEVNGRAEVRRTTGFCDAGRLVRVDAAAPLSEWASVHDILWPCGVLIGLVDFTEDRRIEPWTRYEGPLLAFSLPASWRAQAMPQVTTNVVRWRADIEVGAQRIGSLRIDAVMPVSAGEAITHRHARIQAELRREGLEVARVVERLPDDPHPEVGALAGWQGMFRIDARAHEDRYEVRVAHREVHGLSVDYVMLAPVRGRHPMDFLRATRALEIAICSTETPDDD